MNFCTHCGTRLEHRIPPGDNLPRHVCPHCGEIQYRNPKIIVGCVAEWDGRLLLCRRAIEPRLGHWTLPAGFMEVGETTAHAATRETFEEAGADVDIDALFAVVNVPHIDQVHLFYRGRLRSPQYAAGEESQAVELFAEVEIPWPELAFRSVEVCLRAYLADRRTGRFGLHEVELGPLPAHDPRTAY